MLLFSPEPQKKPTVSSSPVPQTPVSSVNPQNPIPRRLRLRPAARRPIRPPSPPTPSSSVPRRAPISQPSTPSTEQPRSTTATAIRRQDPHARRLPSSLRQSPRRRPPPQGPLQDAPTTVLRNDPAEPFRPFSFADSKHRPAVSAPPLSLIPYPSPCASSPAQRLPPASAASLPASSAPPCLSRRASVPLIQHRSTASLLTGVIIPAARISKRLSAPIAELFSLSTEFRAGLSCTDLRAALCTDCRALPVAQISEHTLLTHISEQDHQHGFQSTLCVYL